MSAVLVLLTSLGSESLPAQSRLGEDGTAIRAVGRPRKTGRATVELGEGVDRHAAARALAEHHGVKVASVVYYPRESAGSSATFTVPGIEKDTRELWSAALPAESEAAPASSDE